MKTWHERHEVTSKTLTLTLPEYFSGKTVDVIVQPVALPATADHYQIAQTTTTGVNAIFGKWPGEETDAEINELLEQLS